MGSRICLCSEPEFSINNQFVQRITLRSEIAKIQTPVLSKGKIPVTFFKIPELRLGAVWAYNKGTIRRHIDLSRSL